MRCNLGQPLLQPDEVPRNGILCLSSHMTEKSTLRIVLQISFIITVLSFWLLMQLNTLLTKFAIQPHSRIEKYTVDADSYSGFLVHTNGCHIPDLDPFDQMIRKFIYNEKETQCEKSYGPALVESDITTIFINESVLPYYNVSDLSELTCCYTPFWRVEAKHNPSGKYPGNVDRKIRYAKACTEFSGQVKILDEFIKVECFVNSSSNKSIYTDFHAFTPLKRKPRSQEHSSQNKDAVSVLIIGVDAVSRLNLQRQMPRTVKFLQNSLNAVEFLGYNKVEDNTFPNLVPVFTGLSVEELKAACWPSEKSVFDECSFVWDLFSEAGYTTAFAEDASWMGIFSYVKHGFKKQPTDYYLKPFNFHAEEKIGFNKRMNAKLCVGPRKSLDILLGYAYKFAVTMKNILSFGFVWGSSLTHDFLNLGKQGDKDHKEFLEKLQAKNIFDNTILVFMSDHGIRWGEIRKTYQGYLEERLPFLYIAFPNWFGQRYTTAVGNLKRNAKKLTTPFDLHETLLDLLNLNRLEKNMMRSRSEELSKAQPLPRGISLFLPVPGNRTCGDAGIVDHWCTCHQSTAVPTNDSLVRQAADHVVDHINSLVLAYRQCAKLRLNNITNAREEKAKSHRNFKISDAGITDYSLTIETLPGKALFEANVRYNGNTGTFSLVGTVSRINLYGDQSSCVPKYRLRLYCYCT